MSDTQNDAPEVDHAAPAVEEAPVCYNFDPVSLGYTGRSYADRSPLEDDVWHYPGNSTLIAVPEAWAQGTWPVWDVETQTWGSTEDHRGEHWWKSFSEPVTIMDIGDPVAHGYVKDRPPEPVDPNQPDDTFPYIVSQTQFMQQLALNGDITEDEAEAYLARGEIPQLFQKAFAKIDDAKMRFMARSKFIGAEEFDLRNQYTQVLIPLMGKDETYAKTLWQTASRL